MPTRPTKTSDSRSKGFGDISVELDAIPPTDLRDLVTMAIEQHLPKHQLDILKIAEAEERKLHPWPRRPHGGALMNGATYEGDFLTVADPRMIGLDLTPSEAALLNCLPVVLHGPTHAKLFSLGIHGPAVTGGGLFNALHVEAVCFLPSGRFEFARDMRDQTGHVLAVIIPALDEFGETADLVAWVPDTGVVATQHGAVCILGEEAIDGPDADDEEDEDGLRVFPTPLEWLRAGRGGVVILASAARTRWRLSGRELDRSDAAFGRRLRDALRLPEPRVYVEEKRRAA